MNEYNIIYKYILATIVISITIQVSFSLNASSTIWHRNNRYLGYSHSQNQYYWNNNKNDINHWSNWSSWSRCSRTCGGGSSFRFRKCLRTKPSTTRISTICTSNTREFKMCNQQKCIDEKLVPVSEKQKQCSKYKGRRVFGRKVNDWIYVSKSSNPCELICLAKGFNMQYSFGKIKDGSKCDTKLRRGGQCKNGRCVFQGCDGRYDGSSGKIDKCGVCGGKNKNCVFVKNTFRLQADDPSVLQKNSFPSRPSIVYGYKTVTKFPKGSSNIKVSDNSHNYLALQDKTDSYVFNGNWKINRPGSYKVDGFNIIYNRSVFNETISIDGPTKSEIKLMALMIASNPGIQYEYWHPGMENESIKKKNSSRNTIMSKIDHEKMLNSYDIIIPTFNSGPSPLKKPLDVNTEPTISKFSGMKKERLTLNQIENKTKARHKRKRRKRKHINDAESKSNIQCKVCKKVKGTKEHFCKSDFVMRVRINKKAIIGDETRYEVSVIQSYKNVVPILAKEYIWVPNSCHCPKFRRRKQYLIMGQMEENFRNRESRLVVNRKNYVRRHNNKNVVRVLRIKDRKKAMCKRRQ